VYASKAEIWENQISYLVQDWVMHSSSVSNKREKNGVPLEETNKPIVVKKRRSSCMVGISMSS